MRSALVLGLGANVVLGAFTNSTIPTVVPSTNATMPSRVPSTIASPIHPNVTSTGLTMTAPTPPLTTSKPRNPQRVGNFRFFACESSTAGFPFFKKIASTEDMDLDFCAASCPSRFFGVFSTDCFCGEEVDPATSKKVDEALCNTPCPGNSAESCGGSHHAMLRRQQVPSSILLSVYIRDDNGTVTSSGTITSTITSTRVSTITSCPPEVVNCPVGHKTTEVVTITTEICPVPSWDKQKIVCYGNNCAPEVPCSGEQCQHHRVICDGDECHTEVCSSNDNWYKLVICNGNDCNYHQCTGDACNTKVICYGGKCAKEECYGDECQKKFVCNGDECGHQTCSGPDCHECEVCNEHGDECHAQPPCNGAECPVPPPPSPVYTNPAHGGSGTQGGYYPVVTAPTATTYSPEYPFQTNPPLVAGATKASATIFGAVLGLVFML